MNVPQHSIGIDDEIGGNSGCVLSDEIPVGCEVGALRPSGCSRDPGPSVEELSQCALDAEEVEDLALRIADELEIRSQRAEQPWLGTYSKAPADWPGPMEPDHSGMRCPCGYGAGVPVVSDAPGANRSFTRVSRP